MRSKATREKLLFRYSSAVQRGDFAVVAVILAEAERDPVLARQIAEIDAVYAAEPIPTFISVNGHHQKREKQVSVYIENAPRARSLNWAFAAAAALVLIGTLIFANRPPADDLYAGLPNLQATETATAFPTPTLMMPTAVPENGVALPFIGGETMPVLCTGMTNASVSTELRSLPTLNMGIVTASLAPNTSVAVVDVYQAETEGWYYVVYEAERGRAQGWVNANALHATQQCAYAYRDDGLTIQLTYIVQPGDTLLSIAARFSLDVADLPRLMELNNLTDVSVLEVGQTLTIEVPSNNPLRLDGATATATAMPTVPPPALDGMMLTATAIIQQVTATAQGIMATATPISP